MCGQGSYKLNCHFDLLILTICEREEKNEKDLFQLLVQSPQMSTVSQDWAGLKPGTESGTRRGCQDPITSITTCDLSEPVSARSWLVSGAGPSPKRHLNYSVECMCLPPFSEGLNSYTKEQ